MNSKYLFVVALVFIGSDIAFGQYRSSDCTPGVDYNVPNRLWDYCPIEECTAPGTFSCDFRAVRQWMNSKGWSNVAVGSVTKDDFHDVRERITKLNLNPQYAGVPVPVQGAGQYLNVLTGLQSIDIGNNELTQVPSEILNLHSLVEVDLAKNNISSLPNNLCSNWPQLKKFTASALSEMPMNSILGCENLSHLSITNGLISSIPESITQLSQLDFLHLRGNRITSIPIWLSKLSALYLDDNLISQFDINWGVFQNLKYLGLSKNGISEIPASFYSAKLPKLEWVDFSVNNLTIFPSEMKDHPSLSTVSLDQNNLDDFPWAFYDQKRYIETFRLGVDNNKLCPGGLDPALAAWIDDSYNMPATRWRTNQRPGTTGSCSSDRVSSIRVDFRDGVPSWNSQTNIIYRIFNQGSSAVTLDGELRYYLTNEPVMIDAVLQTVPPTIHSYSPTMGIRAGVEYCGGDKYSVFFKFEAPITVNPGEYSPAVNYDLRLNHSSWPAHNKDNDYSYIRTSSWTVNPNMAYWNAAGVLKWGNPPNGQRCSSVYDPASFSVVSLNYSVPEAGAMGSLVGAVILENAAGGQSPYTYRILSGSAGAFSIDSDDGEIKVLAPLNYRTQSQYVLTIEVEDANGDKETGIYTINILPDNARPIVDAGRDQFDKFPISGPGTAFLKGEVLDDGKYQVYTAQWTVKSGPGTVQFSNSQTPISSAVFSEAGRYVLILTAYDGLYTVSDEVLISFCAPGHPVPEIKVPNPAEDRCEDNTRGAERVRIQDASTPDFCSESPIQGRAWTVDGQSLPTTNPEILTSSLAMGSHSVSLTVTDGNGLSSTTRKNFDVVKCQFDWNADFEIRQLENGVSEPAERTIENGGAVVDVNGDKIENIRLNAREFLKCQCYNEFNVSSYAWAKSVRGGVFEEIVPATKEDMMVELNGYGDYIFRLIITLNNGDYQVEFKTVHMVPSSPEVTQLRSGCANPPQYCSGFWNQDVTSDELDFDVTLPSTTIEGIKDQEIGLGGAKDNVKYQWTDADEDFDLVFEIPASQINSSSTGGFLIRRSLRAWDKSLFIGFERGAFTLVSRRGFNHEADRDVISSRNAERFVKVERQGLGFILYSGTTATGPWNILGRPAAFDASWLEFDKVVKIGFVGAGQSSVSFQGISFVDKGMRLTKPNSIVNTVFGNGNLVSNWSFENRSQTWTQTHGNLSRIQESTVDPGYEGLFFGRLQADGGQLADVFYTFPVVFDNNGTILANDLIVDFRYRFKSNPGNVATLAPKVRFYGKGNSLLGTKTLTTYDPTPGLAWLTLKQLVSGVPSGAVKAQLVMADGSQGTNFTMDFDNVKVSPISLGNEGGALEQGLNHAVTSVTHADGFNQGIDAGILVYEGASKKKILGFGKLNEYGEVVKSYPKVVVDRTGDLEAPEGGYEELVQEYYASRTDAQTRKTDLLPVFQDLIENFGETEYEASPTGRTIRQTGLVTSTESKSEYGISNAGFTSDVNQCYFSAGCAGACSDPQPPTDPAKCAVYQEVKATVGNRRGRTYTNEYGLVAKSVSDGDLSTAADDLATTREMDNYDRTWQTSSPAGIVSSSEYNSLGEKVKASSLDEGVALSLYGKSGSLRFFKPKFLDERKQFVANVYDPFNNLTHVYLVNDPDGTLWNQDKADDSKWPVNAVLPFGTLDLKVANFYGGADIRNRGKLVKSIAYYRDQKGQIEVEYEYNENGQQTRSRHSVLGWPEQSVEAEYTVAGQLRKSKTFYDDGSRNFSKSENLHYDEQGRVEKVTDGNGIPLVSNTYHPVGPLRFQDLASGGNAGSIQYRYDFVGRQLEKNHLKWDGAEWVELPTFKEKLEYDEYGQVISRSYRLGALNPTDGSNPYRNMKYSYDSFNRLTAADFSVAQDNAWSQLVDSTDFDGSYRYDVDGRITELGRAKKAASRALYSYEPGTHRLKGIDGLVHQNGISRSGINFTYDGSGNMIFDRGLKRKVNFGWHGKPEEIINCETLNSTGSDCAEIRSHYFFVYDANGNRAAKVKVNHD